MEGVASVRDGGQSKRQHHERHSKKLLWRKEGAKVSFNEHYNPRRGCPTRTWKSARLEKTSEAFRPPFTAA